MDKEEWQKLQKENPKEYKNKYLKFMYSEDNAYNCDECPNKGALTEDRETRCPADNRTAG